MPRPGDWTTVAPQAQGRRLGLLTLEAVDARYSGNTALRDVSLAVRPGELCAVLGPERRGEIDARAPALRGARPRAGRVTIFGEDLAALDRRASRPAGRRGAADRSRSRSVSRCARWCDGPRAAPGRVDAGVRGRRSGGARARGLRSGGAVGSPGRGAVRRRAEARGDRARARSGGARARARRGRRAPRRSPRGRPGRGCAPASSRSTAWRMSRCEAASSSTSARALCAIARAIATHYSRRPRGARPAAPTAAPIAGHERPRHNRFVVRARPPSTRPDAARGPSRRPAAP